MFGHSFLVLLTHDSDGRVHLWLQQRLSQIDLDLVSIQALLLVPQAIQPRAKDVEEVNRRRSAS